MSNKIELPIPEQSNINLQYLALKIADLQSQVTALGINNRMILDGSLHACRKLEGKIELIEHRMSKTNVILEDIILFIQSSEDMIGKTISEYLVTALKEEFGENEEDEPI